MIPRMPALVLALVAALAVSLGTAPAARALDPAVAARSVDAALAEWDVEKAARIAGELLAERPSDSRALLLAARVAFYESDYPRAKDLASRGAEAGGEAAKDAADMREWLTARESTWNSFQEERRGPFVVRVTPRDAILVPYAFEALEGAARAMKEEFGYEPKRPVVVEFYPTRRAFIAASTLTREEVETSGTLAICHFNRIMMLSPAVLARGYDWLDALCHEYIHYTVYNVGGSAIPVWLHEGIAKHLETRWRLAQPAPLEPRMASILAEGLETGRWVTFEQMHPSMAKLPSGELVSLAFSQVAVTAQMLREQRGGDALSRLVGAVRDAGGDLDAALKSLWNLDTKTLEERARAHAEKLGLARVPGMSVFEAAESPDKPDWLRFADEGETPNDPEAEARSIEDRQAQDWVLIADRLKGREFFDAAIIEYDKALARLKQSEPLVANKKAHALMLQGRPRDAVALLTETLKYAPSLAPTLDNLAEAHVRLAAAEKDAAKAEEHRRLALGFARESERINPFSIDTHVRLASLLEKAGQAEAAAVARERIAILRQSR